jgi:aspartate/methionine/tyrosine aminotransferase
MMAGGQPVPVPTTRDYQLDVDAIARAIGDRTRAVVTVSPNNPTGAVYSEESLRAVSALCRERRVFHIHDETYEYFTYDNTPHFSPGSIDGASAYTVSLFSMSKAYGMASWRVGYMVIPESLWDAINKIQDTLLICAPVVSQVAAVAALRVGRAYAASKMSPLAEMRQMIGSALDDPAVPCTVATAPGAFYFFVRVFAPFESLDLTERLIREHRVAVVPGSAFGGDECSIRVSYGALDPPSANEGARRLVRGLQELARV